jgi:hypothetical protein
MVNRFNSLMLLAERSISQKSSGTLLMRCLRDWRQILVALQRLPSDRPGILSPDALTGLFGELWILRRLVMDNPSALTSWVGPHKQRFDFQYGANALEVKTTAARDRVEVDIHGIDQLEPLEDGVLHLIVIAVERTNVGGHSLPELVAQVGQQGVDALVLAAKLRAADYAQEDAKHYADMRFIVNREVVFKVDEGFPRIRRTSFIAGNLPSRVKNLRYALDLNALPGVLGPEAANSALRTVLPEPN